MPGADGPAVAPYVRYTKDPGAPDERRLAALLRPAEIDDRADLEAAQQLKIFLRRGAVMGRAQQAAHADAPAIADGIAANHNFTTRNALSFSR